MILTIGVILLFIIACAVAPEFMKGLGAIIGVVVLALACLIVVGLASA